MAQDAEDVTTQCKEERFGSHVVRVRHKATLAFLSRAFFMGAAARYLKGMWESVKCDGTYM